MVNYYLAMFDAILVASGDMKYFICHVIPQNHVIEGSWNFMSGSSSLYIPSLLSLVVVGIVAVEI